MSATLEIILFVNRSDSGLEETILSLVSQMDRDFSVLLSSNLPETKNKSIDAAQQLMTASGIKVRRIAFVDPLREAEYWNWTFAQAECDWIKPLESGEQLDALYLTKFKQRVAGSPEAQLIRCDLQLKTDWGVEIVSAPFARNQITRTEFLDFFPAKVPWLSCSSNFAYQRTAWLASGGFSPYLRGSFRLGLNVMLALHGGMENIREPLVIAKYQEDNSLNGSTPRRVNLTMELFLLLRQAKNYCLASKLPWPNRCLLVTAISAAVKQW